MILFLVGMIPMSFATPINPDPDLVAFCHPTENGLIKIIASPNSAHAKHGDFVLPTLDDMCVSIPLD